MRKQRKRIYLGVTTSTCANCLLLIPAKIIQSENQIYFEKNCPEHGLQLALISEDAHYYIKSREYAQPGYIPNHFNSSVQQGCPRDCGLCPAHEQHCCQPIIEITDMCDLQCPICIADNRSRGYLAVEDFQAIIANLIRTEGSLENVSLSGGEPTLHPDFWEIVQAAIQPQIMRVAVLTNGLRIAQDLEFCRKLKENNIYIILQWDGADDNVYQKLRGQPLAEIKQKALKNLGQFNIATQLIFTAARGVNDHELANALELLFHRDHIISLVIQPLTFASRTMKEYAFDPLKRFTIPGLIAELSRQSKGLLKKDDFFPLPCPNPECVALTYLLRLETNDYLPFTRFVDIEKYLHLMAQSANLTIDSATEQLMTAIINDLWSTAGEIPDSQKIISALRRTLREIYNGNQPLKDAVKASEKQAKSISLHHYMDAYNFDLARVMKCCHHYPRSNGRIYPMCSFNLFYREKEASPYAFKR